MLLEEIYICLQHFKNVSYSDILMMPTQERRFFLGLLTKDKIKRDEAVEEQKEQQNIKNSKGSRTRKVSGAALKERINNGDVPLK